MKGKGVDSATPTNQTPCPFGTKCKFLSKDPSIQGECKWYHPPEHLAFYRERRRQRPATRSPPRQRDEPRRGRDRPRSNEQDRGRDGSRRPSRARTPERGSRRDRDQPRDRSRKTQDNQERAPRQRSRKPQEDRRRSPSPGGRDNRRPSRGASRRQSPGSRSPSVNRNGNRQDEHGKSLCNVCGEPRADHDGNAFCKPGQKKDGKGRKDRLRALGGLASGYHEEANGGRGEYALPPA